MIKAMRPLTLLVLTIFVIMTSGCVSPLALNKERESDTLTSESASDSTADVESVESEIEEPDIALPVIADSDMMIEVPYISQEEILPNGCEAVSAVMVLQHLGFDIEALDFAREYLVTTYFTRDSEDRLYGPNPENWYAGDPEEKDGGFGCYPPALVESIEDYIPEGYTAMNLTGTDIGTLANSFLANDIPVIIWLTIDMEEPDYRIHWYDLDDYGKDDPADIWYPANLHVLVLCGYDGESFIFADPHETRGFVRHSVEDTIRIYEAMGQRAVAVVKNA